MNLKTQKRLAADILGVGKSRVWLDPNSLDEISKAITKDDVRDLVSQGLIEKKSKKGNSRGRARRKSKKQGSGSRKGSKGARESSKDKWKKKIRAQRKLLKKLRDKEVITSQEYQRLYAKAKGGFFRDRSHILTHVKKITKEDNK